MIKRNKGTKAYAQKIHALRRLEERYEIKGTDNLYNYFLDLINGKSKDHNFVRFVTRQSNRVTVFEIAYKNKKIITVYDSNTKKIVTFLPEGVPDNQVGNPLYQAGA